MIEILSNPNIEHILFYLLILYVLDKMIENDVL